MPKKKVYVCGCCGSQKVETKAMVDINTGNWTVMPNPLTADHDDNWCRVCEQNVPIKLVTVTVPKEKPCTEVEGSPFFG